MKLFVQRYPSAKNTTMGKLYLNGVFFCDTLEDLQRPIGAIKVKGKTAIPAGTFYIKFTPIRTNMHLVHITDKLAVLFDKEGNSVCAEYCRAKNLPELLNVPNFTGIRIHSGNNHTHTDGCLLVGKSGNNAQLKGGSSVPVLKKLYEKMIIAVEAKEIVTIQIKNSPEYELFGARLVPLPAYNKPRSPWLSDPISELRNPLIHNMDYHQYT